MWKSDFCAITEQSTDPMEGGKKIPLLVEFLILNAVDVMPPGFNADNVFSILNPVSMNDLFNRFQTTVPVLCSEENFNSNFY